MAYNSARLGEVLELADRRGLGPRAARREGSNPSFPTVQKKHQKACNHGQDFGDFFWLPAGLYHPVKKPSFYNNPMSKDDRSSDRDAKRTLIKL